MSRFLASISITALLMEILLLGCSGNSVPPDIPTITATDQEQAPTTIPVASPTDLPGLEVVPLSQLGKRIPWLAGDASAKPAIFFFYLNLKKPPFDNISVRQAFAAALDRLRLAQVAGEVGVTDPHPATTFVPPETLGRDLYNAVGIRYDAARARSLLAGAGFPDGKGLPPLTLLISTPRADVPAFNLQIIETVVEMWRQNLGVTITVETLDPDAFMSRIKADPPNMFRLVNFANNNDPAAFLPHFHTGAEANYGGFTDPQFDRLIDVAAGNDNPAERQRQYIEAERLLCETDAALIPLFHAKYP
jgi:oligopeptide transport system substrate-binding protein